LIVINYNKWQSKLYITTIKISFCKAYTFVKSIITKEHRKELRKLYFLFFERFFRIVVILASFRCVCFRH